MFSIELTPTAKKELDGLEADARDKVEQRIDSLAKDPRPLKVEKLKGGDGLLRVRAGSHRIVYFVEDERVVVLIVRIGHRREVYRNLDALRSKAKPGKK